MDEKAHAIEIAKHVLDDMGVDPDGDFAVLARQLLRALERLGEYTPPAAEETPAAESTD